jgi:dihydroorotate dehydrogenase subfamily 2
MFATKTLRWGYANVAKPLFFRRDPEDVHDAVTALGERLGACAPVRALTRALLAYEHPSLESAVLGIRFANPVGLSAGFDKNARLLGIMPAVGFGFEEIGSITGEPCEGNPRPRLWRLPKSKGLAVWYGLKNDGCEAVAARLRGFSSDIPFGTSVARTNSAATVSREAGIADYAKAFRALADVGDYFTVNVSCPNTCGGEPFASPEALDRLLAALDAIETRKPVFLKLPADASAAELDALIAVADRHRVHGFVIANLTKRRDRATIVQSELAVTEKGGISGRPVSEPSNALIAHAYRAAGSRYVIIGVGGIFSAEDAYEKIRLGASLVQLVTGLIFEGPQLIGEINRGLAGLLRRDGFANVADAVGTGA